MAVGDGDMQLKLEATSTRTVVVLGAVAAFAAACSSGTAIGTSSTGGFAGSGSPGGQAGSSVTPLPDCPQVLPLKGQSCSRGTCEYGGNADPACNTIARCYAGEWQIETPESCPSSCPAQFDDHKPGDACSGPQTCTYREATCGCAGAISGAWTSVHSASGPDAGASVPDADADAEAGVPPVGYWQCVRPGNGCPARMPLAGTHCTKPIVCDYGTCVFGVPLTMECDGFTWLAQGIGQQCP
jgi:hypothetical protein